MRPRYAIGIGSNIRSGMMQLPKNAQFCGIAADGTRASRPIQPDGPERGRPLDDPRGMKGLIERADKDHAAPTPTYARTPISISSRCIVIACQTAGQRG